MFEDSIQSIYGMKVVVHQDAPKMQLSPRLREILAPKVGFADEFDRWLLQFFGKTNLVPDGQTYVLMGKTLVMNPRTYQQMRASLAAKEQP
jgi:hypothetical protein